MATLGEAGEVKSDLGGQWRPKKIFLGYFIASAVSSALPDLFSYLYLANAASLCLKVASVVTGGRYNFSTTFLGNSLQAQRAHLSLTFSATYT